MRIALYGGSFDPPHLGHLEAARTVMRELRPDRLLVVPASLPPHKALPAGDPGAEQRLKLCRLTFESVQGAEVSDLELRRSGRSYTADTVRRVKEIYPKGEITLALGADMLLSFEQWREFEFLLKNCSLAAFPRKDGERAELEACAARLREKYAAGVTVLEHTPKPMSSKHIRELLPRRQGATMLESRTYEKIIRERWYGALPELDWLRRRAYTYLEPRRVAHVAGCEQEAVKLALRWGADPGLAAEAAILHDITKKLNFEQQLILFNKYGIISNHAELDYPRILHAITGAALARDVFGVSDGVYGAIRWHTTGRAGMTTLEKIMYLADYIEPTRDFPGVEGPRELAYADLDAAMALALKNTLDELDALGQEAFVDTAEAYEYYAASKK